MSKTVIQTTHTGSLPRPHELVDLWRPILENGIDASERLEPAIRLAVKRVVERQYEVGLDIVNDGEMGKISYATYVKDRLTGFGGESRTPPIPELRDFPEFAHRVDPHTNFPPHRRATPRSASEIKTLCNATSNTYSKQLEAIPQIAS